MHCIKVILLFAAIAFLTGCITNSTEPEVITDPTATSEYYILNESNVDLDVTYDIAFSPMDSTVRVVSDFSTKIFHAGDIGSDPPPSTAFSALRFYSEEKEGGPLYVIEEIADEDWTRSVRTDENVARYELRITEENIQ